MAQMASALKKLPPGQMQKLQAVMKKAMAGKDVGAEAEALAKTLPIEVQSLMGQLSAQVPDEAVAPSGDKKETRSFWKRMLGK